jgi:tetratricopeptide (TPR) repeat protein
MENVDVSLQRSEAMQYLERAHASEEQNEFEKALEECDAAIRIDPRLADAHNLRGVILEELGRREEAVIAYSKAVHLDSGFQEARENLREMKAELKEERARLLQIQGKGFGIRAAAYIIDTIVYYGSSYVAGFLGGLLIGIVLAILSVLTRRDFYFSEKSL